MNTIFTRIKRAVASLLIAVLTAAVVTSVVMAGGPYVRSEGGSASENLWKFSGPQTLYTLPTSYCAGGYCGTLTQPTGGADITIYAWNMASVNNIYDWCAYIPSTLPTAAVRYDVWEKNITYYWYVLVNQANHRGQYVYLGYSDYPNINDNTKFPDLRNQCQSGYACDGRTVYFDPIKYTTYPTRDTSCQ